MKKIFILGFFALLSMQACKKDSQQLIDGERPEDRVAADMEKYKEILTGSENGWVAYLETRAIGGSYNFYMDFGKDNKVIMRADFDEGAAEENFESTYRLKQVMAPSIIFDTYTLIHLLQDPDPNSFDGNTAVGYGSDFEFEIREQVGDTLKLIGKKRKAPLILIKASAEDKTFYTSDQFAGNLEEINKFIAENPYTYIPDPADPNKKIQVSFTPDVRSRSVSFTALDNNEVKNNSGKFSFSKDGLRFPEPITVGTQTFAEFLWDRDAGKSFLVTTTGTKVEILKSETPIIPLHIIMGLTVSELGIPGTTPLPGSGTSFITAYNAMRTAITNRFSVPTVARDLGVAFDGANKTFTVFMYIVQSGTNLFAATYTYSYTKTDDGEYKFTGPPIVAGGAGAAILPQMNTFILNRLTTETFTLDYYNDAANKRVLGKMTSKQSPNFSFSGVIE